MWGREGEGERRERKLRKGDGVHVKYHSVSPPPSPGGEERKRKREEGGGNRKRNRDR